MDYNKGYEDFDWSTLSKKELDQLYHAIIDHAIKDNWYKIFVMEKWNLTALEFHRRAVKSLAIRIKREKEKDKMTYLAAKGILKYCDDMPGDPEENYQKIRDHALHVYGNRN